MPKAMPKNDKPKNKAQQVIVTKEYISEEDAKNNRYPNSEIPGVHSDSAPIGGG